MTPAELTRAMSALDRANEIRTYRAVLKREMAEGDLSLAEALRSEDDRLVTMRVRDLLLATPGFGPTKVRRALDRNHLGASIRLCNVSPRRREELLAWLGANHPRAGRHVAAEYGRGRG